MQRMIVYEQGLGGVTSGAKMVPDDPRVEATAQPKPEICLQKEEPRI